MCVCVCGNYPGHSRWPRVSPYKREAGGSKTKRLKEADAGFGEEEGTQVKECRWLLAAGEGKRMDPSQGVQKQRWASDTLI